MSISVFMARFSIVLKYFGITLRLFSTHSVALKRNVGLKEHVENLWMSKNNDSKMKSVNSIVEIFLAAYFLLKIEALTLVWYLLR